MFFLTVALPPLLTGCGSADDKLADFLSVTVPGDTLGLPEYTDHGYNVAGARCTIITDSLRTYLWSMNFARTGPGQEATIDKQGKQLLFTLAGERLPQHSSAKVQFVFQQTMSDSLVGLLKLRGTHFSTADRNLQAIINDSVLSNAEAETAVLDIKQCRQLFMDGRLQGVSVSGTFEAKTGLLYGSRSITMSNGRFDALFIKFDGKKFSSHSVPTTP
jgi:hypothetical protein